jgi:hypothetical protein
MDSAAWTGRWTWPAELPDAAETPVLLSDDPLPPAEPGFNVFGQEECCKKLYQLTLDALAGRNPSPRILALHGRYGQGKTSVLNKLRQSLEEPDPHRPPIEVGEFTLDASRPDDLAYEFERVIAVWTLGRRIALACAIAAVLGVVAYVIRSLTSAETLTALGVASYVTAASLLSAVITVFAFSVRWDVPVGRQLSGLFLTLNLRGARRLFRQILGGKPCVLIVDNIDRAVVEQQRAFLFALRRHRHLLPRVVIVAFDETALSMADPAPDAPQELLAKVFSTSVRLYPSTATDAVNLAEGILRDLSQRDPGLQRWPMRFLRDHAAAGDLARIFLAHRRHSVRFCKQFVNALAVSAAMLRIDNSADFTALMRLHGLFEFMPWLRHDPRALEDRLDDEEPDALLRYAASLIGREKLVADLDGAVRFYLRVTRHMQPAFADWSDFVARFGARPERRDDREAPSDPTSDRRDLNALLRLEPADRGPTAWGSDATLLRAWMEFDTKLAQETDAARRRAELRSEIRAVFSSQPRAKPALGCARQRLGWVYLLQRLWLADPDFGGTAISEECDEDQLFLAETALWWDDAARSRDGDAFAQLLAESNLRDAFLRLAWAVPAGELGLVRVCLSIVFLEDRVAGERRAIPRLLGRVVRAAGENDGLLTRPALLAHGFQAENQFSFVSGKLPVFPRGRELDQEDEWRRAAWLSAFRGRMHRSGLSGALHPMTKWIEHVRTSRGDDPKAIGRLLTAVASTLPRFGGEPDGAWYAEAVAESGNLLSPPMDTRHLVALDGAVRAVAVEDAPNLLLFAILAGNGAVAAVLARRWRPVHAWPHSYLRCLDEVVRSGDAALGILKLDALARHRAAMRRCIDNDDFLRGTALLSSIRPANPT